MRYLLGIFIVICVSSNSVFGQEQTAVNINLQEIAPNLPLYTTVVESREEGKARSKQIREWLDKHYIEYSKVRHRIIKMVLDGTITLTVSVNGAEVDARDIYNLESWELDYGLTEEEWQPIWQRIQAHRESNSTD